MRIEDSVRHQLDAAPITEGVVAGATPLYAERYLLHGRDRTISGHATVRLAGLLNGSCVREGNAGRWRTNTLPGQTLLVPPRCATRWRLSGGVDIAVFYFTAPTQGASGRFVELAAAAAAPLQFFDALVSETMQQIFHELHRGMDCDHQYAGKLADVMLEQACRALVADQTDKRFLPRHAHFHRLQKVLSYIGEHPGEDLSIKMLAHLAGVSQTHFRQMFQEATGQPAHRYVLAKRLEKARKLLAGSSMPVAAVAVACGFSSQSHLTVRFNAAYAITPAAYRKHATAGLRLKSAGDARHAIAPVGGGDNESATLA